MTIEQLNERLKERRAYQQTITQKTKELHAKLSAVDNEIRDLQVAIAQLAPPPVETAAESAEVLAG